MHRAASDLRWQYACFTGHSFKPRNMSSAAYLRQKREFLHALKPSAAVVARMVDTRGHLCNGSTHTRTCLTCARTV